MSGVNVYSLLPDAGVMKAKADRIQAEANNFQALASIHAAISAYSSTTVQLTVNGNTLYIEGGSIHGDEIRKQALMYLVQKMTETKTRYQQYVKEASQ